MLEIENSRDEFGNCVHVHVRTVCDARTRQKIGLAGSVKTKGSNATQSESAVRSSSEQKQAKHTQEIRLLTTSNRVQRSSTSILVDA